MGTSAYCVCCTFNFVGQSSISLLSTEQALWNLAISIQLSKNLVYCKADSKHITCSLGVCVLCQKEFLNRMSIIQIKISILHVHYNIPSYFRMCVFSEILSFIEAASSVIFSWFLPSQKMSQINRHHFIFSI